MGVLFLSPSLFSSLACCLAATDHVVRRRGLLLDSGHAHLPQRRRAVPQEVTTARNVAVDAPPRHLVYNRTPTCTPAHTRTHRDTLAYRAAHPLPSKPLNHIPRPPSLKHAPTDNAKARAWIRLAINEQSLESYLVSLQGGGSDVLRDLYEPWAYLRDVEQAAKLQALLASISFTVPFDMYVGLEEPLRHALFLAAAPPCAAPCSPARCGCFFFCHALPVRARRRGRRCRRDAPVFSPCVLVAVPALCSTLYALGFPAATSTTLRSNSSRRRWHWTSPRCRRPPQPRSRSLSPRTHRRSRPARQRRSRKVGAGCKTRATAAFTAAATNLQAESCRCLESGCHQLTPLPLHPPSSPNACACQRR